MAVKPGLHFLSMLMGRLGERAVSRYRQATPRERQLVLGAAVMLPVVLLVFGFWLPLKDRQQALRIQVRQLESRLYEASTLADTVSNKGHEEHRSLVHLIDNAARHARVQPYIVRIRPQPGLDKRQSRLLVSIRHAPFRLVVRFLASLAARDAYFSAFKLYPATGHGQVNADMTITGR